MASPTEFPLFPMLPPELRRLIWSESILDHNHERLVPIHEETKRVVCTSKLASPTPFYTTSESRAAAIALYPVQLPVSRIVSARDTGLASIVNEAVGMDSDENLPHGTIYISLELDIFVFIKRLVQNFWEGLPYDTRADGSESRFHWESPFRWESPSLSLPQCQSLRSIMLYDFLDLHNKGNECRGTTHCALRRRYFRINRFHDQETFSGVQTCLYVSLHYYTRFVWEYYCIALNRLGNEAVEEIGRGNITYLDKKDIKKYQEAERAVGCVCPVLSGPEQVGLEVELEVMNSIG
ncbi:hypothetical protein F5Y12DRAFT_794276 [Xylaria sp. FL1777]|nr:hypothetical protein F5Y12DRAFT_794276 [Xylaria sp. FL1777]